MANDKKFVVKNGLTTQNISFVDDINSTNNTITVTMLDSDTLSFSGDSGQLFSITDSLTGTIFAVNDISGVPSIEVDDDGTIRLAETFGNLLIGTATDDGTNKVQIDGNLAITGALSADGSIGTSGQTLRSDGTKAFWSTEVGYTGSQGPIGYTGSVGYTGSIGYTGSQGETGFTGSIGFTGSQGIYGWITKTANYTAQNLDAIIADTNGGAFTITLPATPSAGDTIVISDGDDFSTNNLTVARNGSTIEGVDDDFILNIQHVKIDFVYDGTTWQVFPTVTAANQPTVAVDNVGTVSASVLDLSTGNVFEDAPSTDPTYVFSNPPASGNAYGFTFNVSPSATVTITWPVSIAWPGGNAPTPPASGETSIFVFYTLDGGTNYYGFIAGEAMS